MTVSLQFLTRQGCHLCDDALAMLDGILLEVIDVDLDLELLERYDARVPVLIDPDSGAVLMEGKFDDWQVGQLKRALGMPPPLFSKWRRRVKFK